MILLDNSLTIKALKEYMWDQINTDVEPSKTKHVLYYRKKA